MPRPYHLGQRQQVIEQTRARILEAARAMLISATTLTEFSMEAIARQADVARMTVYHQFGSKLGLLESLCDTLAASGGMDTLANAFRSPRLQDAIEAFIRTFCHMWTVDRDVIRRLNAFAVFDPDLRQVIMARNERRRHGLDVLLARHRPQMPTAEREILVAQIFAVTSFECADILAGLSQTPDEIVPQIVHMTLCLLAVPPSR